MPQGLGREELEEARDGGKSFGVVAAGGAAQPACLHERVVVVVERGTRDECRSPSALVQHGRPGVTAGRFIKNGSLVTTPAHAGRSDLGERLSGFIYGTILALSVIVAGARSFPDEPGNIAVLVLVTCLVFWLAHVYAHAVGRSVAREQRLSLAGAAGRRPPRGGDRRGRVRRWSPCCSGAGRPPPRAAVWAAFGLGLAVLAAQGVVFARVERLGRLGTLAVVAANLGLGLVALKLLLAH